MGVGLASGPAVPDRHLQNQEAVAVDGVEPGPGEEVAHAHGRRGVEKDIALDAAQTPEVLGFEIRPVRPAEDLDRERILAVPEVRRDAPFGRRLGVLAETHFAAVDPDVEKGLHGAEMKIDVQPAPVRGHGKRPAIRSRRVGVAGDEGRPRVRRELVVLVDVDRDVVTLELPV